MTKQPKMDWLAVKAELHRRGMTLTALAKDNGLDPYACLKISSRTHFRAQEVIAKFLDLNPEEIWPDRYPKGKPRILDTAKYPRAASQKSSGAADKRGAA